MIHIVNLEHKERRDTFYKTIEILITMLAEFSSELFKRKTGEPMIAGLLESV
ncbi:hypothetical protein H9647_00620 [Paenibacillus sp. Sa2BVA9]|uniref:Resolvase/invertase-type recombinase catalytic domain-containing protein n=1 Tax=Paenibacillus gallinarum TaxID=2762232 RepID=A0ABR8SST0_9BACL|nr:hypothetical protein [Paenibacillus gallinarum]